MTKRFVIATDPLTPEQVLELKNALKSAGWWHWLPNFWLVKDPNEIHTVGSIRDAIKVINDSARCLVIEVESKTWGALTKPDSKGREMAGWIKENWDAD